MSKPCKRQTRFAITRLAAMRVAFFGVLLLAVAGLNGCGGGGGGGGDHAVPVPVMFSDETLVQFRPYAQGEYVIRTRAELQAAWAAAPFAVFPVGIVLSEPAFPEYDFQSSMLVGVSLGIGKWCFKPVITNVWLFGPHMEVDYKVPTSSTLACLRDGPLISFALVPRFAGTVAFRNISEPTPQAPAS